MNLHDHVVNLDCHNIQLIKRYWGLSHNYLMFKLVFKGKHAGDHGQPRFSSQQHQISGWPYENNVQKIFALLCYAT